MNVSDYILDFFNKKGVDTCFLVTGGQAMYLDDALARNKNYNFVCVNHEQAAAMSADAYGRTKGKPAICMVTAGPGAVNALNGVAGGYTDSSPMIVISGQANLSFVKYEEESGIRQFGVQGIDIKSMVSSIVKRFFLIDSALNLDQILETAYSNATTGRPGPVWLDVPLDIQRTEVQVKKESPFIIKSDNKPVLSKDIDYILDSLEKANKPLLLLGQGIKLSGSEAKALEFANKHSIPIITSRLGIDIVEYNNPLFVGHPGNYGDRAANFAVEQCDLLISLGCRLATSLVGHNSSNFAYNAKKIVIDIDRKELNKPGVTIDYKIEANCKDVLTELSKKDKLKIGFNSWTTFLEKIKRDFPVCLPEYSKGPKVNSYYFTDQLSKKSPNNCSVLLDTGSCFHVVSQAWKIKKGQHFLTTGGLSSMGYWCACIGACLGNNRQSTITITGDGSLQMNIQEMATISHYNLPIKLFVLNNNGYLLIRFTQHNFMNDRFIGESPKDGLGLPSCEKMAKAYGFSYFKIDNPKKVDETIDKVLATDGPVLCEVITPEWQLICPRVASEKLSDGSLISHDYDDMYPYIDKNKLARIKEDAKKIKSNS